MVIRNAKSEKKLTIASLVLNVIFLSVYDVMAKNRFASPLLTKSI